MTNAMLLALAFLCGVPVGAIIGALILWRVTRPAQGDEPDYSGGV